MSGSENRSVPRVRAVIGVILLGTAFFTFFQSAENDSGLGYVSAAAFFVLGILLFFGGTGQWLVNAAWKLGKGATQHAIEVERGDRCEVETKGGICAGRAIWLVTLVQHAQQGRTSFLAGRGMRCCNEHHPVIWDENSPEDFQDLGKKAYETKLMLNKLNLRPERIAMIPRIYG